MAGRSLHSNFPRARSPRRQSSWAIGPFGSTAHTTSASKVFPTGAQALLDGLTIVRIRGELVGALSGAAAALDGFSRVGVGICITNENAAGLGITAIPTPLTDIAWEGWIWHSIFSLFSPGIIAGGAADDAPTASAMIRMVIDSKAMRKIKNTDVVTGVVETADEVGSANMTLKMNTRMLTKLA